MNKNIILNGKERKVGPLENLEELVTSLFEKPGAIIVELNENIIKKTHWKEQPVAEGDVIEMIQLVGGG
jgi:thiamine biosynthesis protein ThiS